MSNFLFRLVSLLFVINVHPVHCLCPSFSAKPSMAAPPRGTNLHLRGQPGLPLC